MKPLSKGVTVKVKPLNRMTEQEMIEAFTKGTPITREDLNKIVLENRERKKKKGK